MELDNFLADRVDAREWTLGAGMQAGESSPIKPDLLFLGKGQFALEVLTARSAGRPTRAAVRALWQRRHANRPSPVVLVVAYPGERGMRASLCGPVGDQPPVIDDVELAQAERLCAAALDEPNRHTAQRMLSAALPEVAAPMPGVRNAGMLATHELETGVPARSDWSEACDRGQRLAGMSGRRLVEGLGYSVTEHAANTSILTDARGDRAIAVFLQDHEGFEEGAGRFSGSSPATAALAQADRKNLPWVVLTRARQIRVYSARPDVGVGRKGRAETFVELNLALLPDAQAGYLPLLFGSDALVEGGSFESILADSADYASALGARLRDRVYTRAVPTLATAIARRSARPPTTQADLDAVYEQALVVLFRLLFVAYAEDKDLLPYRSNDAYRGNALKTMARDLAEELRGGDHRFDTNSTRRWLEVRDLWAAVHRGEDDWGVPAYDGGLFSGDATVNPAGAALAELELTNSDLGPALSALLVDVGPEGPGPVDFRSLSVREFGTVYEGLLESSLSIAPSDLAVDAKGTYLPARAGQEVVVEAGEVYFHNRSGVRKSTGSYFTKPFAVEHLLDTALEPALDDHLERLSGHLDGGDEAAAAAAFFDFRCVDLAMGSGHFLVAAVDRIEARLSAFLALRPIPLVQKELAILRESALERLGPLASSVEIEQSSLLRRQVARRCVYGVDRNGIAVELARLAIWIHTFVSGLPLSFLDHSLVEGDSLTGIGTVEEALLELDPSTDASGQQHSLFRERILAFLDRASEALRRLGRITETTTTDVEAAREAHLEALRAVEPARRLFDLLVAARLGEADRLIDVEERHLATHRHLGGAERLATELRGVHFPIAFPEVFLRDRPGFDCILGNPPWEESTVEELKFWSLRFPGLQRRSPAEQEREIRRDGAERPELVVEYAQAQVESKRYRAVLHAGPFPGMGTGDPDVYKAFAWRFITLIGADGTVGVVLPRSVFTTKGSTEWRQEAMAAEDSEVVICRNRGHWVFDDVNEGYTINLVTLTTIKDAAGPYIRVREVYSSRDEFIRGVAGEAPTIGVDALLASDPLLCVPALESAEDFELFTLLVAHRRFGDPTRPDWRARATTDLHATKAKEDGILGRGSSPVFNHRNVGHYTWEPEAGVFSHAEFEEAAAYLDRRRMRAGRNSAFSEMPGVWNRDPQMLPARHPRIVLRDVVHAAN